MFTAIVTTGASGLVLGQRLRGEVKGMKMCSYFYTRHLTDAVLLLVLLSLAKLSNTEESENLYLKSSIHDIPIYSSGIVPDEPYMIQRRNDFFLKAGKSVPRIGRRNDENIRETSYKLIPQIDALDQSQTNTGSHQVSRRRNDFLFAKTIPRIGRRNEIASNFQSDGERYMSEDNKKLMKKTEGFAPEDQGEAVAAWPWFRNPELFSPYQKRNDKHFANSHTWSDNDFVFGENKESPSRVTQCLRILCEVNDSTTHSISSNVKE